MRARVLSKGKPKDVELELQPMQWLVPRTEYDRRPMWFVFGGLVFQRVTAEYLRNWGDSWWDKAPKGLLHDYYYGLRRPQQREVVVLAQVLADDVNVGYESFANDAVTSVDGKLPVDMADFVKRMDRADGEVVVQLASGATVLLDVEAARSAEGRIRDLYYLPGDRSQDLPKPSKR